MFLDEPSASNNVPKEPNEGNSSSEWLTNFYQTTWPKAPDDNYLDSALQRHHTNKKKQEFKSTWYVV